MVVQGDKATIIIITKGYMWEENGNRNFEFKGIEMSNTGWYTSASIINKIIISESFMELSIVSREYNTFITS